jgi:membrane protein implicated in regulation of membrane protease activity
MVIFATIAVAAFIVVAGAFLLGHDHDLDHDFDHDFDHDVAHGGSPDTGGVVSIFSTRVVFTFIMGFGAAGAIANSYGASYPVASLIGVAAGMVLGALMYGIMLLFVEQQASSIIPTNSLLGCTGTVTVPIDKDSLGEIGVSVAGEYRTFAARLQGPGTVPKGHTVRIVGLTGSILTVEEDKGKTE